MSNNLISQPYLYKSLSVPVYIKYTLQLKAKGSLIYLKGPWGAFCFFFKSRFLVSKCKFYTYRSNFPKTLQTTVKNLFHGLQFVYSAHFLLKGLGFKFSFMHGFISFKLGFSHLVLLKVAPGLRIKVLAKHTGLKVFSINQAKLKIFSAYLRSVKLPEPYKGKGVSYADTYVPLKAIKKI